MIFFCSLEFSEFVIFLLQNFGSPCGNLLTRKFSTCPLFRLLVKDLIIIIYNIKFDYLELSFCTASLLSNRINFFFYFFAYALENFFYCISRKRETIINWWLWLHNYLLANLRVGKSRHHFEIGRFFRKNFRANFNFEHLRKNFISNFFNRMKVMKWSTRFKYVFDLKSMNFYFLPEGGAPNQVLIF